ncbi:MAG: NAD(P)H-dependent oxidoreductase [Pseudomonadota bacterium]
MTRVLVLFAHPRTDRSEANAALAERAAAVPGVTLVDLYAEYPTFEIDVEREQERLTTHDVIVLQHPLYWYSSPAILKEWQDLVLEYGFAYGPEGHALDDKIALNAVTTGARREAYSPAGGNGAELRTLLVPFEKTFHLCRMRYLAPFVLFGAGTALDEERLEAHGEDYEDLLTALVDGRLDVAAAESALVLPDDLAGFFRRKEPA